MPLTKPRQALDTSKLMHGVGRPIAWCTPTAVDGSRWARLTEVLISSPTLDGSMPDSASALPPAMAAPSAKVTPSAHQRRSKIPASRSISPGRRRTRRYVASSRSSSSAEVTTLVASTALTESTAVLVGRYIALPMEPVMHFLPGSDGRTRTTFQPVTTATDARGTGWRGQRRAGQGALSGAVDAYFLLRR